MKHHVRYSLIMATVAFAAGLLVVEMQVTLLSEDTVSQILDRFGDLRLIQIIASAQLALLVFVFSYLGLIFIDKTHLNLHTGWKFSSIVMAVVIGTLAALSMFFLDYFVFKDAMATINDSMQFSLVNFASGILFGGIVEEVIIRQFFLSGTVFLLARMTRKDSNSITVFAVVFTAILFSIVSLPTLWVLGSLTRTIMFRTVLINMIPALLYGYIFAKKGLSYSILAHVVAYLVLHLIIGI